MNKLDTLEAKIDTLTAVILALAKMSLTIERFEDFKKNVGEYFIVLKEK